MICLKSDLDESSIPALKVFWQNKYRDKAQSSWDKFYVRNKTNFFKDRHWIESEFGDLESGTLLEVGCGVGNLIYPLLERNPALRLYACDFSKTAIDYVKANEGYARFNAEGRLFAFTGDITKPLEIEKVDLITCIFVLSAIPPELHAQVIANLRACLKPGGKILFRDYAAGDLTHTRFKSASEVPKLEDWLYVRSDGTMTYFFTKPYFERLTQSPCKVIEKRTTNRKLNIDEARLFIQSVFN